jgi:hypothetical protein
MEPVEAKAVDRISKSEILDPEIPKSWIRKSQNLGSRNPKIRHLGSRNPKIGSRLIQKI